MLQRWLHPETYPSYPERCMHEKDGDTWEEEEESQCAKELSCYLGGRGGRRHVPVDDRRWYRLLLLGALCRRGRCGSDWGVEGRRCFAQRVFFSALLHHNWHQGCAFRDRVGRGGRCHVHLGHTDVVHGTPEIAHVRLPARRLQSRLIRVLLPRLVKFHGEAADKDIDCEAASGHTERRGRRCSPREKEATGFQTIHDSCKARVSRRGRARYPWRRCLVLCHHPGTARARRDDAI